MLPRTGQLDQISALAIACAMFAALAACSNSSPSPAPGWTIGPTISGHNYSTGSAAGDVITVQDVHYVTRPSGPLAGTISMSFHLDKPLTGTGCGKSPASASLYFQRKGDDWNTDGWRWWATFATVTLDHAGDYNMAAPLNGPWTSVFHETAAANPEDFAGAKAHASVVGFTLGNCTGYGHGATGPATLAVTSFQVL